MSIPGAPKLPTGLFYRVKRSDFSSNIEIEIRRKYKIGSTWEYGQSFWPGKDISVGQMCTTTYEEFLTLQGIRARTQDKWAEVESYLGDHE